MHPAAQWKFALPLAIAFTAMLTNSPVRAADGHSHDNDDARYRHMVMESLGSNIGALSLILTNRVAHPEQLQLLADALATTATIIPTLFPAGSEGGDALPLIWQEPDKVAEAARRAVDATAALAGAAQAGDRGAITKAFKEVGASCKGCHESYKKQDD